MSAMGSAADTSASVQNGWKAAVRKLGCGALPQRIETAHFRCLLGRNLVTFGDRPFGKRDYKLLPSLHAQVFDGDIRSPQEVPAQTPPTYRSVILSNH